MRLRDGDAAGARTALEGEPGAGSGAVLECRARASYLELAYQDAVDLWEQAYALFRSEGDAIGAVRVARTLGFMYGAVVGDPAVMRGWIARAQTLLGDTGPSPEHGWVALNLGMFEGDRVRKEELFREAFETGHTGGDPDLEFLALAYLGASLVHADRAEEGMVLLDEALAAVAGGEVEDFTALEEIFCQLFSACEHAHDVARADQWIRVGEAIAARRKLPAVSAFCHTHYGGVLTAAGRWDEAERTLAEAVRLWGLGHQALRGGALVRLADLRVRQGRFEEAEQFLAGMEDSIDAARPVAAIHLARGELSLAAHVLERALRETDPTATGAAPLLALLVDVRLALGDLGGARSAADALETCASAHPSDYLEALAALASGQLCLATETGDPSDCLHRALAGFGRAQLPMELARTRLALARLLVRDKPEVAMTEARAALESFERLQAARDADAAAAMLRSLGAGSRGRRQATGPLSKREEEVLDLIGHGLSNPEIADRLYISRKTVEHHVGNVLTKLGLRSRAEAAAYAARSKPAPD